jgi:kynurenine formamidase
VDAPAHLADAVGAITVDKLAVDALIGPAKKIDASGENLGPGDVLSFKRFQQLATASGLEFGQGDVALFEFGWDRYFYEEVSGGSNRLGWWGSNEPGLDEEICRYLSNKRVRAVGSDTAGCDIAEIDGRIVSAYGHEEWLLPKGVLLIEGLQGLSDAPAEFVFVALPLRIAGGSGSPVRAIGIVAEAMDCGAQERVTEAEGLKATP